MPAALLLAASTIASRDISIEGDVEGGLEGGGGAEGGGLGVFSKFRRPKSV